MTGGPQILGGFRLLDADDSAGKGGQGTVRRAVCERTDFPGLAVHFLFVFLFPGTTSCIQG